HSGGQVVGTTAVSRPVRPLVTGGAVVPGDERIDGAVAAVAYDRSVIAVNAESGRTAAVDLRLDAELVSHGAYEGVLLRTGQQRAGDRVVDQLDLTSRLQEKAAFVKTKMPGLQGIAALGKPLDPVFQAPVLTKCRGRNQLTVGHEQAAEVAGGPFERDAHIATGHLIGRAGENLDFTTLPAGKLDRNRGQRPGDAAGNQRCRQDKAFDESLPGSPAQD